MRIGTKSLLFGAHQFLLHPIMVAIAWTKLFGLPTQWQLWLCFFLHDIGYWGCPEMDGPVGKKHPELGAKIVGWLCGPEWKSFCARHSRSYARIEGRSVSALCAADKLATAITPRWLYICLVRLTGEYKEYLSLNAGDGEPSGVVQEFGDWLDEMRRRFTEEAHNTATSVRWGQCDEVVADSCAHIQKINGSWGFWDEAQFYFYGGYDSPRAALVALDEYARNL